MIERDLHDGVQQHLVALAMRLQLALEAAKRDSSTATVLLEELARDVQDANDEATRLALRIHPPRLNSGSLRAALRSWAMDAGLRATLEVQLSPTHPPDAAATVYFCCLDALENVGAGAHVTISVRDDEGLIMFEVEDDAARPQTGLDRLRDRVGALGGSLELRAEPDGRTWVSCSIPAALRS